MHHSSKKRAIDEFRAGASVADIRSKYRAIGDKPLAQWKAHVTMGTYAEVKELDADVERITKPDAIELLSSGIPPREIYDCYPSSFSVGQLRAFKAHITMGSYQ